MRNDTPTLRILLFLFPMILFTSVTSAAILLDEDFDDGTADGFTPIDGNWQVENGTYRCDLAGADVFSLAMAGDETWTDYVAECEVRIEGSPNAVFAFRVQDTDNFYDVNIRPAPFNDVVLSKEMNGMDIWSVFASYGSNLGDWHHVRVSVVKKRIKVWIDDTLLIEHVDPRNTYLTGGIATAGYCGGTVNEQTAWFDDVLVYTTRPGPIKSIATDLATWDEVKTLFR